MKISASNFFKFLLTQHSILFKTLKLRRITVNVSYVFLQLMIIKVNSIKLTDMSLCFWEHKGPNTSQDKIVFTRTTIGKNISWDKKKLSKKYVVLTMATKALLWMRPDKQISANNKINWWILICCFWKACRMIPMICLYHY
jgi:hypothetical protein